MKRLTIGILAHVDSGKTTLSEAMLYKTGEIKTLGRVDHKDSFLDNNRLERDRGITIFSKQAVMEWDNIYVTLLDTPGHVDFSAEMERTLSVLDYAILVISGNDGIQSHTETLWQLLSKNSIPTIIFVNKMDIAIHTKAELMSAIKDRLNDRCVDFSANEMFEEAAMCDEALMDNYISDGTISSSLISTSIASRRIFPCYFGSALKSAGIEELLKGIAEYTLCKESRDEFGARVFKIARDQDGSRLTYLKVTGGKLSIKDTVGGEKINQIRIYSGQKYKAVDTVEQGMVCAVTGLASTKPGDGIGIESDSVDEYIEPFLTYKVIAPQEVNIHNALIQLRELAEEDPKLHVEWNEGSGEITIQMMGDVQMEILTSMIEERFGFKPEFDQGSIVYKETITDTVEGVGHFEPLRHYAEVHLIMEPGERGSGLVFDSMCSQDDLDKNWQNLIMSHLSEKEHLGVLIGAPITDMKITLAAGRASKKHTEGGDFRQATYRAVRNGLMKAESILLEPWLEYTLRVPTENVGRAMSDIEMMSGTFKEPGNEGDFTTISGSAPASEMVGYQKQVISYTKGRGQLSCSVKGFEPCHDQPQVLERMEYDPERDMSNTADSVFCTHGESSIVKWDQVGSRMDLASVLEKPDIFGDPERMAARAADYAGAMASDKELMDIFERTYGPIKHDKNIAQRVIKAKNESSEVYKGKDKVMTGPTYIIVDGYNVIHAWEQLSKLADTDFAAARDRLIDILCNYQGFTQEFVIVVFDAYKVKGNPGSKEKFRNINVIYTKEAETADMYIERVTHDIAKKHKVRVVTSDALEQVIILGHGALRVSSREFGDEVKEVENAIKKYFLS